MLKKREKPSYTVYQNLRYILKKAWKHQKSVLVVMMLLILMTVATSTLGIYLPKVVVACITQKADVGILIATIIGFTIVTAILYTLNNYFSITIQGKRTSLRLQVCQEKLMKVLNTDYSNIKKQSFLTGQQKVNDLTNNNSSPTEAIYDCLTKLGTNGLGLFVYLSILISISPLLLVLVAITTLMGYYAQKYANAWRFNHDDENAKYNKRLFFLQQLGGQQDIAKDIRVFHMSHWIDDVYKKFSRLSFDFDRRAEGRYLFADIVDCVGTLLREGITYAYLIWRVLEYNMPVDEFILLFGAVAGLSVWLMGLLDENARLHRYSLDFCRVREFLEYPETFKNETGEDIQCKGKFEFEFKNVSFKYPGAKEYTLKNINLKVKQGEKLAIVGLNGAGKTSLIKLLCGFHDPTEGEVLVNGRDIKSLNRNQYYDLFTAVFQEFNILPISVAENVGQSYMDGVNKEKLHACLKQADILEKINSLPQKENSLMMKNVHEEAVEFSGGEIQKLMLARALYKDSPVLILDEPTAALDPIAESELYNKYNDLSKDKTAFYISHRLASTRFCSKILLIKDGGIIESGSHEELLAKKGEYARLFDIQSQFYVDEKEAV